MSSQQHKERKNYIYNIPVFWLITPNQKHILTLQVKVNNLDHCA